MYVNIYIYIYICTYIHTLNKVIYIYSIYNECICMHSNYR